MSNLFETIAVIIGSIMALGGLGISVEDSNAGGSGGAGCLTCLVGIALVALGLGFYSDWHMSNL